MYPDGCATKEKGVPWDAPWKNRRVIEDLFAAIRTVAEAAQRAFA